MLVSCGHVIRRSSYLASIGETEGHAGLLAFFRPMPPRLRHKYYDVPFVRDVRLFAIH